MRIVCIASWAGPPSHWWAHAGAGVRVPLFSSTTTDPASLLKALARAAGCIVDVDLWVAVFLLLLAGALACQVSFDSCSCANRIPPATWKCCLNSHHLFEQKFNQNVFCLCKNLCSCKSHFTIFSIWLGSLLYADRSLLSCNGIKCTFVLYH